VADYLERYAERFDLPVLHDSRVDALGWDGERYVLRAGDRRFEADNVVVATGAFQRPRVPAIAARLSPEIHQLHSSEYRSPFALPEGPVLVVGAGNSGAQIALELSRFRKVWLAGRDTGYVPRRALGRDAFDWIWPLATRATVNTSLGRRLRSGMQGGDARIGIPKRLLADAAIVRTSRVCGERGGLPACDDLVLSPRVVVWCTGFAPDYGWIDLPVTDERGLPRHTRGAAEGWPGLHFLGLRFQHRLTSSLLGGVGADAAFIAGEVARRSAIAAA
jgi:putative flavoprotein involved in K+ transport